MTVPLALEIDRPWHYADDGKRFVELAHEEEALIWLWWRPDLLGWPRTLDWVDSPRADPDRQGDLWGIDSAGHLLIIEAGLGPAADLLHRLADAHARHPAPGAAEIEERWRPKFEAELAKLPHGGILPRSVQPRRDPSSAIARWPRVAMAIAQRLADPVYAKRVKTYLQARSKLSTRELAPSYGALFVMPSDRELDLTRHVGLAPLVGTIGRTRLHAWRAYAKTSPDLRVQLTLKELVIA